MFKNRITAWAQLLRLPNLFTVPGDPLIGFLVMHPDVEFSVQTSFSALLAICSALSVYLYGLVSNDLADFSIDCKERPHRPLPSGHISKSAAWLVAAVFAVLALSCGYGAGVLTCAFSFILLVFVSLYNFSYKSHIILGPALLGLCRVSSVLLGASVAGGSAQQKQVLFFVLPALFFYIYGLSETAQRETETLSHRRGRAPVCISILIILLTILFLGVVVPLSAPDTMTIPVVPLVLGSALYLVFVFTAFKYVIVFTREQPPAVIQRSIGAMIRNLMFFQAAWCAIAGFVPIAVVMIVLAYNAKLASQKFYGS